MFTHVFFSCAESSVVNIGTIDCPSMFSASQGRRRDNIPYRPLPDRTRLESTKEKHPHLKIWNVYEKEPHCSPAAIADSSCVSPHGS